jgi:hypothetical protein
MRKTTQLASGLINGDGDLLQVTGDLMTKAW